MNWFCCTLELVMSTLTKWNVIEHCMSRSVFHNRNPKENNVRCYPFIPMCADVSML